MDPVHRRAILLVLVAVVCDYVGVGMMRIALPFYAKAMDTASTGTLIGGLEAAYGVGQVVGALLLPRLSDKWGRRPVLLFSFFGSAIGYALAMVAREFRSMPLLVISRIPVGLSKQTVTVSRAVVADCTAATSAMRRTSGVNSDASAGGSWRSSDENAELARSCWMSRLGTAIGLGYSLGPFLGGQLGEHVSDGAPAAVATVIFVLLFPVMALLLPETSPAAICGKVAVMAAGDGSVGCIGDICCHAATGSVCVEMTGSRSLRHGLWRSPQIIGVLLVLALPELGLVAHTSTTLSTFVLHSLRKGSAWLGNLTSVTALAQALLAATLLPVLTRRGWSDQLLLFVGICCFAVASTLIAWLRSAEAVMMSVVPASFAIAVLRSYPATLLSKRVLADRQGEAMGLLDLCSSALRVVAPGFAGLLVYSLGEVSAFHGQVVLFVAAALALGAMPSPVAAVAKDD
eukprot:TRINITY_DN45949_c0_g1_i1.p1 TRINITY_DN45949_c0_g1~~TRINITY_DN45949_c0_g1_i1.p1  ORF type:complete len:459 (+),score=63.16 TRINITY_DN45949_c0_g1_i1:53-1429(+)